MIAVLLALLAAPPAPEEEPPDEPPGIECPAGTEHRGARPLRGFEEYCVDPLREEKLRREGPAVAYYEDGTPWIESRYHLGVLDGRYVSRFRGGRVAAEGAYQAGGRVGPWRFYYEDGTLQEESTWRKGMPDGPFTSYWPTGKPKASGFWCMGAQCGVWKTYDERGSVLGSVEYGTQWKSAP